MCLTANDEFKAGLHLDRVTTDHPTRTSASPRQPEKAKKEDTTSINNQTS